MSGSSALAAPAGGACFSLSQRVYYQHTDAGGMVYHGRYLDFMEAARTEFLQAHGHDLARLAARASVMFVVRTLQVDYLRPAILQDLLTITAEVAKVGFASIRFVQHVLRAAPPADQATEGLAPGATGLLVRADVDLACVDPSTLKPTRLPADMRRSLAAILAPPTPLPFPGEA